MTRPTSGRRGGAALAIYEVYLPIQQGPERVGTGSTISRHKTPEAAQEVISKVNRGLRRANRGRLVSAWCAWEVRALEGDTRRALTDQEVGR